MLACAAPSEGLKGRHGSAAVGQDHLRERFDAGTFARVSDEDWQRYFDVNVMSGVRLSRHVLTHMLAKKWGRIIFIGSESGVNIPADMVHYGLTKAGMLALSNGLAKLTRGTEVTVNTIVGGPTYSDGVAAAVNQISQAQAVPAEELKAAIIAGIRRRCCSGSSNPLRSPTSRSTWRVRSRARQTARPYVRTAES